MRVFHVGMMKTGTTYIQSILAENRDTLRAHGWRYPGKRLNHQHAFYGLCQNGIPWNKPEMWTKCENAGRDLLARLGQSDGNFVVSAEALSSLDRAGIRQLVQRVGKIDRVIFTTRDLVSKIPSAWQQHVKGGGTETLEEYIRVALNEREEMDAEYANNSTFWRTYAYGESVKRWAEVTGAEVIVVKVAEKSETRKYTFDAFARAAGINAPINKNVRLNDNSSLRLEMTELVRRYNITFNHRPGMMAARSKLISECIVPATAALKGTSISLPSAFEPIVQDWDVEQTHLVNSHAARVISVDDYASAVASNSS